MIATLFSWKKGYPERWSRDGELLVYAGDLLDFERSEPFEPDRMAMMNDYSAIGQAAAVFEDQHRTQVPTPRDRVMLWAEASPALQTSAVEFVKTYGPPVRWTDLDDSQLGRLTLPLRDVLYQARELHQGMRLVLDYSTGREAARKRRRGRTTKEDEALALMVLFREHQREIRKEVWFEPSGPRSALIIPYPLPAMWDQLEETLVEGRTIRKCDGCFRVFVASRRDQRYHDEPCRNRSAVKRSKAKAKGDSQ